MPQAFLTKIETRQTKVGPMYDLLFSNGDKIGAGKFAPKGVAEGDYVKYEYTMNGNFKNLAAGSLSKIDKPAGVAAPAPRSSGSSGNFDERQDTISKQAALNSAIALATLAQSAEALPLGAKTLAPAKRLDALLAVINEFTAKFYHQATGKTMVFPEAAASLSDEEAADVDWNAE